MLQLNDDQLAAQQDFTAFVLSPDKEFVISGAAGVGKTTLLKSLMEMKDSSALAGILDTEIPTTWCLTATTNKAAEVLTEATGIQATTIHSLLGLIVRNDYETGNTKLSRTPNTKMIENSLIVVDECSMVDSQLRKMIGECTFNCKILYVGDHCQLAPVGEPISPVFRDNKIAVLNKIVRSQHTPAITALSKQLRQIVETGEFTPLLGVPGVIDYMDGEQARAAIIDTFKNDVHPNARILCYTNNKVIRFNEFIRNERQLPVHFTPGEFVISNTACFSIGPKITQVRTRVEEEMHIVSTDDCEDFPFWVRGKKYGLPCYQVNTYRGSFRVPRDVPEYRDMLKETARLKEWSAHFALKEHVGDLRPRDACTVYKAQGSTYESVFVDLGDIGTCTNASQAARMLYVAGTRPTHHIYFIGSLPKRFLGEQ